MIERGIFARVHRHEVAELARELRLVEAIPRTALGKPRRDGGYDNADPRAWLARQGDWRARANAAQANSFEGLPFFIGAVLAALQLGAPQGRVDLLALLYVMLRLGYIVAYVGGMATMRSAVWALAFAVNVAILFQGWR
mgnify:CR=1 FL=1